MAQDNTSCRTLDGDEDCEVEISRAMEPCWDRGEVCVGILQIYNISYYYTAMPLATRICIAIGVV